MGGRNLGNAGRGCQRPCCSTECRGIGWRHSVVAGGIEGEPGPGHNHSHPRLPAPVGRRGIGAGDRRIVVPPLLGRFRDLSGGVPQCSVLSRELTSWWPLRRPRYSPCSPLLLSGGGST